MSWVLVLLLALAAFAGAAFVLKAPRGGWEAIGAALLLGIAGYGLQANPGVAGAPKPAQQDISADPAALIEARGKVRESEIGPTDRWIVIADALARNGQYANAAQVLLGAIEEDPENAEAWLAMANALVAHAEGLLTPAASYAYREATAAAPDHPGPPFFWGLALAQSGRFAEAHTLWLELLEQTPDDAPWRSDLESRLEQLDSMVEAQHRARSGG